MSYNKRQEVNDEENKENEFDGAKYIRSAYTSKQW